jgi:hypothetical protein
MPIIKGGNRDDTLTGSSLADLISGSNGNDTIDGGAGNDIIDGGSGNDILNGGTGVDLLIGGNGNDVINGGSGSDIVLAGEGDDVVIHVHAENAGTYNVYEGGNGRDTLRLVVTASVFASSGFQADLSRFQSMIARHGTASGIFGSLDLLIDSFERIEVTIVGSNQAPTLTRMSAAVNTVAEDTQLAITFVDIATQGNEVDVDGSVDAFVVKAVSTGTLLIGTSAGTATGWAPGTNDRIDATHIAFWTGAPNANGMLNAFTVVAEDNGGLESASPAVQVQVSVSSVNDDPKVAAALTSSATQNDSAYSVDLLAGASDVDAHDALHVANVTGLATGVTLSGDRLNINPGAYGSLGLDAFGDPEIAQIVIGYDIADGHGGAVHQTETITIKGINDDPKVAAALTSSATENDAAYSVDLLAGASDIDAHDALHVANVTGLAAGVTLSGDRLNINPGAYGSLGLDAFGHPETAQIVVSYDIVDGHGGAVHQTETITISGVEEAGFVSIGDVTIVEGDAGTSVATFTISRSSGSLPFSVDFASADGTASAVSDYVATSGTLSLAAGETTKVIQVTINGDSIVEGDETFFLNLSNATAGATIAHGLGVGIIINDDVGDGLVDSAILNSPATITSYGLTGPIFGSVFETGVTEAPGAASNIVAQLGYGGFGTDPTTDAGWIWIAADFYTQNGNSDQYQAILAAAIGEYAYTYRFGLSADSNPPTVWTYADLSGTADGFQHDQLGTWTSQEDAGPGSVSIGDVTIVEGDAGTSIATFTVSRSGGLLPFSIDFASADGTAMAGSDYLAASGTLLFAAGETIKVIHVTINGDTIVEGNETFFLSLSNATAGATIADGLGIGSIINDDTSPTGSVSIGDVTIAEGDAGTSVATFTISRSGGSLPFSVDFASADGAASAASDYVATSGTLSFAAGETAKVVQVTINGDSIVEGDETFFLNLSNATAGATIADGLGVGVIINDDVGDGLVDSAILNFPATTATGAGQSTGPIIGSVFETGLTEAPGATSNIVAQLGYGGSGTDPTTDAGWIWIAADFYAQNGNNDEYQAVLSAAAGDYSYTYRFGLSVGSDPPTVWTYADLSGTADGFQHDLLGTWTVMA